MPTPSSKPATPEETPRPQTVIPYIAVVPAEEVIEFTRRAFGAQGGIKGTGSQGGIHAEVTIGDARLMIGGGAKWRDPKPRPLALHLYVEDADQTYRRAMAAGAKSLYEPADMPYGDREGGVEDAGGNHWYIGTLRNRARPAGMRTVTPGFRVAGAAAFIEFLKQAFAAEEVAVHGAPDGRVVNAQIRIGDTLVELSDAHGRWQPMPTTIFLTVADVDETYRAALRAGATAEGAPSDASFGVRMATVRDPFGNLWYVIQPLR